MGVVLGREHGLHAGISLTLLGAAAGAETLFSGSRRTRDKAEGKQKCGRHGGAGTGTSTGAATVVLC